MRVAIVVLLVQVFISNSTKYLLTYNSYLIDHNNPMNISINGSNVQIAVPDNSILIDVSVASIRGMLLGLFHGFSLFLLLLFFIRDRSRE